MRITQIGLVEVPIVSQRDSITILFCGHSVWKWRYGPRLCSAIHVLVPAALVYEVAKVQDKLNLVCDVSGTIVFQHARPAAVVALLKALAANESQIDLAGLPCCRRSASAAGARYGFVGA